MRVFIHPLLTTLAALAIALRPQVAGAEWTDLGLNGREVTQLRTSHGMLFACTGSGLFGKVSDTPDSTWMLMGFAGERVHDVLAFSPETLMVARDVSGAGSDTVSLWRSTDGGANWSPFQNGLGSGPTGGRNVRALMSPTSAPGSVLAATNGGVARSTDSGSSWSMVSAGGKFYFLAEGLTTLWAGGEGATSGPILRRSKDGGASWLVSFLEGVADRAVAMAFDPADANVAYLGRFYGLYKSVNDGASWTAVSLPAGVFHTALGHRAFAPLRLYANGEAPGGGATIARTDDGGINWAFASFPAAASSMERVLLVLSGTAADTILLGMGSGVLRHVEPYAPVGVEPTEQPHLSLSANPNPSGTSTVVSFSLPTAMRVSLRVLDLCGREAAALLSGRRPAGPHRVMWDQRDLASGIYILHLRADDHIAIRRVVILR